MAEEVDVPVSREESRQTLFNETLANLIANGNVADKSFYDISGAIQEAEVGAYKDRDGYPYIFTGGSKKSSAFGPAQITYSTALGYFFDGADEKARRENMEAGNFKDEYRALPDDVKSYVTSFINQGIKKRNNKGGVYGSLKAGDISREDHDKYYPFLFALHVNEKKKLAADDTVPAFVNAHFGSISEDDPQKEKKEKQLANLQTKVATTLGMDVAPVDPENVPEGFTPVVPQPEPKPQPDLFDDDVVEPGTTDMMEEAEQEAFQMSVDAADRDEQVQQAESLQLPAPEFGDKDVAPDTTDAIPVSPPVVDVEPEKGFFEKAMDFLGFDGEDTEEEIQTRDANRSRLLQGLDTGSNYNEGGIATAIQESEDIESGKDTRTKKEMIADQMAGLQAAGKTIVESVPGVGEAIIANEIAEDVGDKDYVGAGLGTAALAVGMLPGGDIAAKGIRKFNKTRKAYKLFVKGEDGELYPLFVNANKSVKQGEFLEADFPDAAFKGKRTPNSDETFYVPTKGAKRSKGEKAKGTGDSIIIPDEATRKKLIEQGYITERTKRTKDAPYGKVTAVAARPGWHASQAPVATHLGPQDLKISKAEAEKLVEAGVTPEAIKRRGDQFYVKRRAEDQVFAEVEMADDVDYQSMLAKEGRSDINDRVPKGGSYRYSDGQADSDQWVVGGDMKVNRVLSREEARAIQKEMGVTDLPYRDEVETILGRTFSKGGVVMDDYLVGKMMDESSPQKFAEGGMPKQMDMFDDGGLMQEGGTVDPESGNEVPVGSLQEEVRDDIPAQLSEGEFVMPADVVRYHGLDKMMALRDEAKAGLARMEAMGQMGNAEEATIPDGIPFNMDDLDMEEGEGYNYNVGGFVPQAGVATTANPGFTTAPSMFANYGQVPAYQAPQAPMAPAVSGMQGTPITQTGFAPPTAPVVPGTPADGQAGFFGQLMPTTTGRYDELKEYVNEETGETMTIPFVDGKPIYPIPEGFTEKKTDLVEPDVPTTAVPTTRVQQQDSGGDDDNRGGPKYATTDASGIGYDKSKVDSLLKDAIDDYGFGFGALADTFGKASIAGAVTSMMGKDPKVSANTLTSASFGGVIDAHRGGNVNFTDRPGRKTGKYDDTTSLHEMSLSQQRSIANVARTVVEDMRGIFVDNKGKPKSETAVKSDLIKAAKAAGISVTIPGTNINYRLETIARELSNKRAKEILAQKEAARQAEADRVAALASQAQQSFIDYSTDPDTGSDTYMGGPMSLAEAIGGDFDVTGTAGAFTGDPVGMEDEYDFNEGGLVKQMENSGFSPK